MNIVKTYDIETATSRFEVTISSSPDNNGFEAKYYGTTPKFAQVTYPGDPIPFSKEVGMGSLTGDDVDNLLKSCIAEIKNIDGEVISVREL